MAVKYVAPMLSRHRVGGVERKTPRSRSMNWSQMSSTTVIARVWVFRFSAGASDSSLFARRPRDEIGVKEDAEPTCGLFVAWTAGPFSKMLEGCEMETSEVTNHRKWWT